MIPRTPRTPDRRAEGFLTVKQAAELLGIHPRGMAQHIEKGYLPATREKSGWYIAHTDLDHFIATRRKPGQPKRLNPIPCVWCKSVFDPIEARQCFCSPKCSQDAGSPRKIQIDEGLLRRLYLDEELTTDAIGVSLKVSGNTVLQRLHDLGIPIRSTVFPGDQRFQANDGHVVRSGYELRSIIGYPIGRYRTLTSLYCRFLIDLWRIFWQTIGISRFGELCPIKHTLTGKSGKLHFIDNISFRLFNSPNMPFTPLITAFSSEHYNNASIRPIRQS